MKSAAQFCRRAAKNYPRYHETSILFLKCPYIERQDSHENGLFIGGIGSFVVAGVGVGHIGPDKGVMSHASNFLNEFGFLFTETYPLEQKCAW